jgi:putative transposase
MEKKESYRHMLPHFQQPGQAYFVTWNLKDAVPPKALERYALKLQFLRNELRNAGSNPSGIAVSGIAVYNCENKLTRLQTASPTKTMSLQQEYELIRKKYIKAYDDLLDAARNPAIDLSKPENLAIMIESLMFWENKRLTNMAFTIMPNHVHWVFQLYEKDNEGNPVYLQDILHSVKRFSSNQINKLENRKGALWQKESFDTTIRNDKHLYYAMRYTINNPVKAGLVINSTDWPGTYHIPPGCCGF